MEISEDNHNKSLEEKNRNIITNEIKNEIEINNTRINNKNKQKNTTKNKDKDKYFSKILSYINLNIKVNEYSEITQEKAESLLSIITEEKIMKWEIKLYNNFNYYQAISDEMILNVKKDAKFYPVIINDSKRTRVRESIIIPDFKDILENMLCFYCATKNVYYKQGLNEIFGPLILMKYKIKQLKLSKLYLFGVVFIDKFLPNYFYENDFYALKGSLKLFFILLKYHEPSVYNILDENEIMPEMYATNWIITLMSGKLRLDILFELWDNLLENDDPLLIHFIFVALLILKREIIINCEKTILPSLMSNLTILEKDELKTIIESAKDLRKKTPYSFRILADELGIFIPKCENLKERFEKYKPDMIQAIPIFPQEIFYMTNKDKIVCPNPFCKNGKDFKKIQLKNGKIKYEIDFDILNQENENEIKENNNSDNYDKNKYICEKCDMKIEKDLNYIIIDLRIIENKETQMGLDGFWKNVILLDKEDLRSEEINEILTEKFIDLRGKHHFIFLTSNTDTFTKFESDFYKNNISEEDKAKMIFGVIEQRKEEKELDLQAGHLTNKEIIKLKEYDNLKKILKSMQNHNYPYISFVLGGYYKMHEESININLALPKHNIETCEICKEINTQNKKDNNLENEKDIEKETKKLYKSLWEHKKKIKYQNLVQYFNNSNISISIGSLNEYKGKNLLFEKIQILIAILFSQYKIEIYKFDIKKQHNSNKSNYYDLGLNYQQQKDMDLIILEELKITDILGMSIDNKMKNKVIINIKEKNLKKGNKKEDIIKYHSFNMVIDLSSYNDAKNFFLSFKKMSSEFKELVKKKKGK